MALELFGSWPRHKGDRPVDGAVGEADGGTLVLDEVIGLSPALQRRLLDLVKRGRYHREFEDRERVAQVNVIVITDGNLAGEVQAGRFRHDLYHKLARLDLVLPPLRERPEDVPGAARWMANRVRLDRGQPANVELEGDAAARAGLGARSARTRSTRSASIAGRATSASSRSSSSARSCCTATARRSTAADVQQGARRADVTVDPRKIAERIARASRRAGSRRHV